MKYPTAFLVASLFFHTSHSSQTTKSGSQFKSTKERFPNNVNVALGLVQAFKGEKVRMKREYFSSIHETLTLPFAFPTFDSYDMDLAVKLSKGTCMTPQYIFSILVQIIYTLLQFHIKRLFKLDHVEPFIPKPGEYAVVRWEDSPQHWFIILLGAIMPGAIINVYKCEETMKVNHIYAKPFLFLAKDDKLFEYSTRKNKISETAALHFSAETPAVSVYSLPARFFGKTLGLDQALIYAISLEGSHPSCKKILNHLLQGITFAFDLSHAELEVTIKPTEDVPTIEESKRLLIELFKVPIEAQVLIPEDIEGVLKGKIIPIAYCYHPAKLPFDSPVLYERMLTWIIAIGALAMFQLNSENNIVTIIIFLDAWLKQFLPDSSIKLSKSVEGETVKKACTYNPESSSMYIYGDSC